jgi:hypothetical protein
MATDYEAPLELHELTAGEKAKLAWLGARMVKRGIAGEGVDQSDLQAKSDRVIDAARKRRAQRQK